MTYFVLFIIACVLVLASQIGDVTTTIAGLRDGLAESNSRVGVAPKLIYILKIGAVVPVIVLAIIFRTQTMNLAFGLGAIGLVGISLIGWYAVYNNLKLIKSVTAAKTAAK